MRGKLENWRWFYTRVAIFRHRSDGPGVEQLLWVIDDITTLMEERRAREQLHKRIKLATRGAGIGVWEINLRGMLPIWDETMYMLHGIAPEVQGKALLHPWQRCMHREHLKAFVSKVRTLYRQRHGQCVVTYDFITPAGERKHFRAIAHLTQSPSTEELCLIGIVVDETLLIEQRQQQQKLQHLLEESQRMARMASWEIDPDSLLLTATNELWLILKVPPVQGSIHLHSYREHIHPGDVERWFTTLQRGVLSKQPYTMRYRIIRGDGQQRWMECHGEPVVSGGKVVLLRGTVRDITEQYEQEQELIRAREEALRASQV
jgi:PAS domain-containing protein